MCFSKKLIWVIKRIYFLSFSKFKTKIDSECEYDNDEEKRIRSAKKGHINKSSQDLILDYDLNRAYSLLDAKVDFFAEANVLLSDKIKKQKKGMDDTRNLLATNNKYRQKSSSISNSIVQNDTNPNYSNTLSSNHQLLMNQQPQPQQLVNNNINHAFRPTNEPMIMPPISYSLPTMSNHTNSLASTASSSNSQNLAQPNRSIHPIHLTTTNSKVLEPVRQPPLAGTTSMASSSAAASTSNLSNLNDKNNNSTAKTSAHNTKNHLKDLFNFDSSSLDPFNDMELKTINDLEELKTILQTQQEQQQQKQQQEEVLNQVNQQQTANTLSTTLSLTAPVSTSENSASQQHHTNYKILQANNFLVDNFGLPKISFVDLDINSNKL